MRIVVVDTETTGDGEKDEVVEVACINLYFGSRIQTRHWTSLFSPSVPVLPVARAAHHITDAELASAPKLKHNPPPLDADVLVAHNAEFDVRLLRQSGVEKLPEKTICTWRCSMHLWPDAPKHSNQVLRYHVGFEPVLKVKGPPHRALPDAAVTAGLFCEMMKNNTVEGLIEMSSGPVLLNTVRFGKYRGQKWESLDEGYLHWILSKDFDADAKFTAQHWINKKRSEAQCQEASAQKSAE